VGEGKEYGTTPYHHRVCWKHTSQGCSRVEILLDCHPLCCKRGFISEPESTTQQTGMGADWTANQKDMTGKRAREGPARCSGVREEQGADLESCSRALALHHIAKRPHHESHAPANLSCLSSVTRRLLPHPNPVHREQEASASLLQSACPPARRYLIAYLCLIGVVVRGGRRPSLQVYRSRSRLARRRREMYSCGAEN